MEPDLEVQQVFELDAGAKIAGLDAPLLQIADDRSITLVALPRPVVNPDRTQRLRSQSRPSSDHAQKRVIADRQHQAPGEDRGWTATERQP